MTIEIISDSHCDVPGCRTLICTDDACYCQSCYQELLSRIQELEDELIKEREVADGKKED